MLSEKLKASPADSADSYFSQKFGRIPPLRTSGSARQDRALRLYLFCLRQKRIPLQSLARFRSEEFYRCLFYRKVKKVEEVVTIQSEYLKKQQNPVMHLEI
jgi:hypothetical protein